MRLISLFNRKSTQHNTFKLTTGILATDIPRYTAKLYISNYDVPTLIIQDGVRDIECIDSSIDELIMPDSITNAHCNGCRIKRLVVSKSIEYLSCENNRLSELDLSGCYSLKIIKCANNMLTSLVCHARYIYCSNNMLKTLDVPHNAIDLTCTHNMLRLLDLPYGITNLKCDHNRISQINIPYSVSYMTCTNNRLTELDIPKDSKLFILHAWSNLVSESELIRNATLSRIRRSIAVRKAIVRMRKAWYDRRYTLMCSIDSRPCGVVAPWDRGGMHFQIYLSQI